MRIVGIVLLIYFGFAAMGDVRYIALEYGETTSNDIAGTAGSLTVNLILTFIGAILAMNPWGTKSKAVDPADEAEKIVPEDE